MPTINSDISEISKDIMERFYLRGFDGTPARSREIKRYRHGAMHVARTMLFATAVANLYRKYGYPDAVNLTERKLKILQIAALMHDSARMDEGEDFWDRKSGKNCYKYLIELGCTEEEAREAKNALANKNAIDMEGRSFISKCVNTADSLDIIRVLGIDGYRPEVTDFYRDFLVGVNKKDGRNRDFDLLINAAYRLIYITWDSEMENQDMTKKVKFENKDCLDLMRKKISKDDPNLYILRRLERLLPLEGLQLTPLKQYRGARFDRSGELNQEQFVAATRRLLSFYRGSRPVAEKIKKEIELLREGVNPDRSTTLIGRHTPVHEDSRVALIFIDPPSRDVVEVGRANLFTGFGDKSGRFGKRLKRLGFMEGFAEKIKKIKDGKIKTLDDLPESIREALKIFNIKELEALREYIRETPKKQGHNEVSMDIRKENVSGISFCIDDLKNPYQVKLAAIFLQNEYEQQFARKLPIFEYSSKFKDPREYKVNEQKLINLWKKYFLLMARKMLEKDAPVEDIREEIDKNPLLVNYQEDLKVRIKKELNESLQNFLLDGYGSILTARPYELDIVKTYNALYNLNLWGIFHDKYKLELSTFLKRVISLDVRFVSVKNLLFIAAILENSEEIQKIFNKDEIEKLTKEIYMNHMTGTSDMVCKKTDTRSDAIREFDKIGFFEKILSTPVSEQYKAVKNKIIEQFLEHSTNISYFKDNRIIRYAICGICGEHIIRALLQKPEIRPYINMSPPGQPSPLLIACNIGDINTFLLLIEHGVQINQIDENKLGKLFLLAADCKKIEKLFEIPELKRLIDKLFKSSGEELLVNAFLQNKTDMIQMLLKRNVFYDIETLISYNHPQIYEFLDKFIQKSTINLQDENGKTPVHRICEMSYVDDFLIVLKKLMSAGADFTIKDNCGKTPIDYIENVTLRDEFLRLYELQHASSKRSTLCNTDCSCGQSLMI